MSEGSPPRARRPSLVALLSAALFLELWLNRVIARVLRGDPMEHLGRTAHALDAIALFIFEFVSVFATALFALAVVQLARSPAHSRPLRGAFAVTGGITAVLCAVGVATHLTPRLHAQLYLSTLFALVILTIGVATLSASRRLRAGIVALMVPLGMMLVAALLQRMSPAGVVDPNASMLADFAGCAFVIVGLAAPFLFAVPHRGSSLGITLGALVLGGGLMLGHLARASAIQLAAIGLAISVPINPLLFPLYVLGAASMAYTIGALLSRPGPERLRGVGLLLVCTVGLGLELPYEVAASLVGLICLLESAARPAPDAITRDELDAQLKRWGALVGAAQVTVIGSPGRELGRIGFRVEESTPGVLRIERRAGAIERVELCVGEIPERRPPFTLLRRGRYGLGRQAQGAPVATDDRDFDSRYLVRDHRGAGTRLLDAETRARIGRLVDGLVGVWPQRGARFVGPALPPGDDGLPSLAQLLADLRKQTT